MSHPNDNQTKEEAEDSEDPQLTEIVAYLDGELDEDECLRLEKQLAGSPPLRSYADTLDRTWQLLDTLGQASVSDEFTHKTLASLAAVSELNDQPADSNTGRTRRWLLAFPLTQILIWTTVGFLGAAGGLQLAQRSRSQQADSEDVQLLRHLDLLQSYPKIYPVPNAEFLRRISEEKIELAPKDEPELGGLQP